MSDPADINDRLEAAAVKAEGASEIMRKFSNDPVGTFIPTESGNLPSLAEWLAQQEGALGTLPAELANTSDPAKGAAIIGRGVVAVQSITQLLNQPRKTDLRYLVLGYYAGSLLGGGEFYWDAASTEADNYGTVLAVSGVTTGRFKRILRGEYIRTSEFGIDLSGATSAVARLQAMLNTELPMWLDAGTHLVDATLFYGNWKARGPGIIKIVSDANFAVGTGSPFAADNCICIRGPVSTGPTYSVDLDVNMTFDTYTIGKPKYPINFSRLRDSKVRMRFTGTGHTAGAYTNAPDFYFDNRNVKISGRYVLRQADPLTDQGGMWVRDVGFNGADSATHYSENVTVESDTYIYNDGVDEALAFFNPSGGTMYNCGVEAATIEGGGLGLSILEFNAANRSQARFDCYATNTKVRVNSLRNSQAAFKLSQCVARLVGVKVYIYGFRNTAVAGEFYSGFNNSPRTDAEYPVLIDCKVIMATTADPTSEVRGFDGSLRLLECEIARLPGAIAMEIGVKNGQQVRGGRWPGASVATFDNVADVQDVLPASVTYNNVTRRRGLSIYKTETLTPDGSGNVSLSHAFGATPSYAYAGVENNPTRDVVIISRNTSTVVARVIDRATGAAITSGSFTITWQASI